LRKRGRPRFPIRQKESTRQKSREGKQQESAYAVPGLPIGRELIELRIAIAL